MIFTKQIQASKVFLSRVNQNWYGKNSRKCERSSSEIQITKHTAMLDELTCSDIPIANLQYLVKTQYMMADMLHAHSRGNNFFYYNTYSSVWFSFEFPSLEFDGIYTR